MIKSLNKAGTGRHRGEQKGKYTLEQGNLELEKWVDINKYRCDDCRVVYDYVDHCIMVRTCNEHCCNYKEYIIL